MRKTNGTDAKDIALYFLEQTTERYTKPVIARTIITAKSILTSGYTKEEILLVIDRVLKSKPNVYSLAYISACIEDVLRQIKQEDLAKQAVKVKEEQEKLALEQRLANVEVVSDESKERNKRKAERINLQSGIRKKSYLDMFEK
jgi:hypothetical protein